MRERDKQWCVHENGRCIGEKQFSGEVGWSSGQKGIHVPWRLVTLRWFGRHPGRFIVTRRVKKVLSTMMVKSAHTSTSADQSRYALTPFIYSPFIDILEFSSVTRLPLYIRAVEYDCKYDCKFFFPHLPPLGDSWEVSYSNDHVVDTDSPLYIWELSSLCAVSLPTKDTGHMVVRHPTWIFNLSGSAWLWSVSQTPSNTD